MRTTFLSFLVAVALSASSLIWSIPAAAQSKIGKSEGEIRKIDLDAAKVTIRHGPIVDLDMPSMTMVFRVKDPAMLSGFKVGDRVRFTTTSEGGAFTLLEMAPEQ